MYWCTLFILCVIGHFLRFWPCSGARLKPHEDSGETSPLLGDTRGWECKSLQSRVKEKAPSVQYVQYEHSVNKNEYWIIFMITAARLLLQSPFEVIHWSTSVDIWGVHMGQHEYCLFPAPARTLDCQLDEFLKIPQYSLGAYNLMRNFNYFKRWFGNKKLTNDYSYFFLHMTGLFRQQREQHAIAHDIQQTNKQTKKPHRFIQERAFVRLTL